jgi:hypothetical protein
LALHSKQEQSTQEILSCIFLRLSCIFGSPLVTITWHGVRRRRPLAEHVLQPLDGFHWKSASLYLHEIPTDIFFIFAIWPILSETFWRKHVFCNLISWEPGNFTCVVCLASLVITCWIFRGKSYYYYHHQVGLLYGPKCNWQAANRFELFAGNQLCMRKAYSRACLFWILDCAAVFVSLTPLLLRLLK